MTPRLVRLCIALASSALVFDALAQTPAPGTPPPLPQNPAQPSPAAPRPTVPPAAPEEELVQLKLPDADIDTVISALEIYTGRIALRPQQLQTATYNLKITKPIPKSEAIIAIETVLALNQIGVSPLGDKFLKIVNLQNVRQEAPEMLSGSAFDQPASGKVATKLFQLDFARVQEVQGMLQGVLNPFYGGPVPLVTANAFLITDSISNLQRVELLLQQVDRPVTAGMKPKFYTLSYAKASDLVNKLRTILQGTLAQQLGSATSYNADDRTNQIVLVTDPRQYEFFDDLIARLDQKADPNTRNDVIYLKHAKATDVVNVLSRIISGQTSASQRQGTGSLRPGQGAIMPQPGAAPGAPAPAAPTIISASSNGAGLEGLQAGSNEFSALMTVVNDDRSNSVVVSGTADDIRLIRELIDKLDIVLAQVRIEVVIAEVTLDDNHDSGIASLGLKLDGDRLIGFTSAGPSYTVGGSDGAAGSFAGISRLGGPGSLGRSLDLTGIVALNTTKRKNNTTILTVPAIVTSHGMKAVINDGETRPIISGVTTIPGAATGATTSSQINQQQIGTTLTVTPFIGNDGSVQLDLQTELTDVIDTVTVDNNTQYVIGTRKATSYITAQSGEIKVLGGFRKKIDSKQTNRLGPIPFIGDLFGQRKNDRYHQELVFFLRPTILTNNPLVDNNETMKKVDELPTNDEIKQQLDPNYKAPAPKSGLQKILPK